jgi:hypothetical protein
LKKKIIITQPTFLPYAGYFAPFHLIDSLIILDDVQFEKRSWQQRNRLKSPNGPLLVSVSVNSKGKFNQKINEVLINHKSDPLKKILKNIYYNYKNSNYFNLYFNQFEKILTNKTTKLIDLNISLIKKINDLLEINNNIIVFSSSLQSEKKKFELIHDIYKKIKADELLSTIGTRSYFPTQLPKDMKVTYYEYEEKIQYKQLSSKYEKQLSIIDVLFNLGPEAKNLIKKNLKLSS